MGDRPIPREIVNVIPETLGASYVDGTVVLTHGLAMVFEPPIALGADGARLCLVGAPGLLWEVQRSADLSQWEPLGFLTNILGFVEQTDVLATNGVQRFYRAVRP